MKLTATRLVAELRLRLRAAYLEKARRTDAPRPRTLARKQLRQAVNPIAQDLARQTHAQVTASLGLSVHDLPLDLDEQAYGFVDAMINILESYPIEATKSTAAAFEEWSSVAEEDRTVESLSTLLNVALDGAESKLQNSLRLLFGDTFAQMNKAVQLQAGVTGYYWQTRGDERVRLEHADVENVDDTTPYSWDDPPLTAAKSSSGEPCHPGEDYNCRCVAIPADTASPSAGDEDASESE